jgi:Trypsin-like peptidase domain
MRTSRMIGCMLAGLVTFASIQADAQLTVNVLYRALLIKTVSGQATGFTIDVDGRQYLITAKHVVAGLGSESSISVGKLKRSGEVKFVPFRMKIFRCEDPVDIAVLIPPEQLTVTFPLEPTKKGLMFGQDVYFVGFPFGMYTTILGTAYPFGFVKKGAHSGEQQTGNSHVTFLDGYNVFGFSGSPVVFRLGNDFNVIGVVSGFEANLGPVMIPKPISRADIKPGDVEAGLIIEKRGKTYRLQETLSGMTVKLNTGIVKCYGIEHAVDLIHQHATGPLTSEAFVPAFAD